MMKWRDSAAIAIEGLRLHRVRALLSTLGIVFGVACVVAVVSVSEGAKREMLKLLAAMGANNITVKGIAWRDDKAAEERKKRARLRSEGLTVEEAREAAAQSAGLIAAFAPIRFTGASARLGEKPLDVEIVGTTPSFLPVHGFRIREGRFLAELDEAFATRVCVIEEALAAELFPFGGWEGRSIEIDSERYMIVGILEGKQSTEKKFDILDFKRLNRRIYIPLSCALCRITREPLADEVDEVVFQAAGAGAVRLAARFLAAFYEASHGAGGLPASERDYAVTVARDLVEQTEQSQKIFNAVMWSLAGVSLLVGGIGIMNIMLANVTERKREIGIRRAVGASRLDILRQFLSESLIVCGAGGAVGCVVGVILTFLVAAYTGWQTVIAPGGMAISLLVAMADGVAFGTYPAWAAASLDPVEALRAE